MSRWCCWYPGWWRPWPWPWGTPWRRRTGGCRSRAQHLPAQHPLLLWCWSQGWERLIHPCCNNQEHLHIIIILILQHTWFSPLTGDQEEHHPSSKTQLPPPWLWCWWSDYDEQYTATRYGTQGWNTWLALILYGPRILSLPGHLIRKPGHFHVCETKIDFAKLSSTWRFSASSIESWD